MAYVIRMRCVASAMVLIAVASLQADAGDAPYCGLYAVHAALHSQGIQADFEKMIDPQYLSGINGSTALDLMHLAETNGGTATFRSQMTMAHLRAATTPVVLHTSVAVSQSGYHHWILFLGMAGDSAQVYDPPRGKYTMSGAELLSQWDGNGLIIGRRDSGQMGPVLDLALVTAVLSVLVIGGMAFQRTVAARYPVCSMLVVATLSGMAWHGVVDYGFFWNRYALASVGSRYQRNALPSVTTDAFNKLSGQPYVTIIDARREEAYEQSHVPGAINIPVTATHGSLRNTLATIPVENRVVVYCQSDRCEWADAIAHQFAAHGYRHISIFRGGMNAWQASGAAADNPE